MGYTLKVNDHIDLKDLCKNWNETETSYELSSDIGISDEFVEINKETRIISQWGYTMMLQDYINKNIVIVIPKHYNGK